MPGGRHQHLRREGSTRTGHACAPVWQTGLRSQPQGNRVYQSGGPERGSETGIEWHYIDPGKPQQNAFIDSFNGSLRDELRNGSCSTARLTPGASWLSGDDYNNLEPYSFVGNRTPAQVPPVVPARWVPSGALVPVGQHEYQISRHSS